ncbi:PQQ-binding-like beta-propeller repeat protein [Bacteroidota bacterium]
MKILPSLKTTLIVAIISVVSLSCTSKWPQFRGEKSNMIAHAKNLPLEWGNEQNIKWKVPLSGKGWSSPIVWDNRVFITEAILDESSYTPDTTIEPRRRRVNPQDATYRWMVYCLDLNSGELLWEQVAHEGKPGIETHNDNTYASETPVTDGKRVYAYFGMTGLFCYDIEGNLIWEKNLGAFESQSGWGTAISPVLYKDKLYMQMDNQKESFLLALNKETGEEIWRIPREEKTNWSTPVIWKNSVRTELVTGGQKARSYDPETGQLLWELEMGGGRNISSPVANKDLLFTGNEKRRDGGGFLFAVKAGSEGDITPPVGDSISSGILWSRSNSGLSMPSPLLYDGYIYILDRSGFIFCFEEATGKTVYPRTRVPGAGPFWASPWINDGKVWCLDERGTTHVIKTGAEFEVLSTNSIEDKFWSSTAITGQGYIFRGVENLYCVK